ncbi:hypothetical protein BB561_004373 [Smittium simulii]|uniref:Uncharacterized protein n=1 Tax=Smittium simulii TaxID=133385 RepID=A0A2T9YGL9_9FUNG|nr:hypothetical protein BB561_004373 [Smittium simulii]
MNEETQNFITVDTPMNQVNKQVDAHISEYPRLQILEAYTELIEAMPSLEDDFY